MISMEQSDTIDLSKSHFNNRFYTSGQLCKGLHLVDMYMYDSSLFANILILADTTFTLIIDTGTSKSVGSIINYLEFHNIPLDRVAILPTHHHFDHIGGMSKLIEYLESKASQYYILSTKKMHDWLLFPDEYFKSAKKGFNDAVGSLKGIPAEKIRNLNPDVPISLGSDWILEILETPGHCDDHISPLLTNSKHQRVCFLGEALGINLKNQFVPIPASSAPDFNSRDYLNSIHKIQETPIDLAIFSHIGGIARKENIAQTCENAIAGYEIFRDDVIYAFAKYEDTRKIVDYVFEKYQSFIGPTSINEKLAKNLAFTITYGILMDEGLK